LRVPTTELVSRPRPLRQPRWPVFENLVEAATDEIADAFAVASFYWTVELASGQKFRGRGSHVFVKHHGRWSIVHEPFSRSH
jgi:hypothetical protein